jgi:hypothetical protein
MPPANLPAKNTNKCRRTEIVTANFRRNLRKKKQVQEFDLSAAVPV